LIDQIYAKNGGQPIPVDYQLPDSLQGLEVNFGRVLRRPDETDQQPGDHFVLIAIQAPFDLRSAISDLKLTKASSGALILGGQDFEWGAEDQSDRSYMATRFDDGFYANGLYNLDIVLNDQNQTLIQTWFIVSRALPTNDPVVNNPINQPLTIPPQHAAVNPADLTFQLTPFTSDAEEPFESRILLPRIIHEFVDANGRQIDADRIWPHPAKGENQPPLFASDGISADTAQLQAGQGAIPLLDSGEYRLADTYYESRPFGPFTLTREATTMIRFFVQ
jgi:hypothetical protein